MKPYKTFVIHWYDFNQETKECVFFFSFDDDIFFEEKISFGVEGFSSLALDKDLSHAMLSRISLALWVSYYKCFPTTSIEVKWRWLSETEQEFWWDFYCLGLGEFFFQNKLTPIRPHFVGNNVIPQVDASLGIVKTSKYLLCIWWWKDSLTSAGLLNQMWVDYDVFTFGKDYSIHAASAEVLWCNHMVVNRVISPQIREMNAAWYYNGHVPITWVIHFVWQFVATLYWYQGMIFSNERSANFWNTHRKGIDINHQRSKSYSFENWFNNYSNSLSLRLPSVFSLLRPWNEIRIAREFVKNADFLSVFSSCNRNFHLDWRTASRRCNVCPKCLFVYGVLRPFLSDESVREIWGEELYDNDELVWLFEELWWLTGIKPFECVWSYDEMQYATRLFLQQQERETLVLESFRNKLLQTRSTKEREMLWDVLMKSSSEHLIPLDLQQFLWKSAVDG